jgi:hypothetical protein
MTPRDRNYLKQEFKDGERPSGQNFAEVFDSFLNKTDDGLTVDAYKNLELSHGLKLGTSETGSPGLLRFDGDKVQFHNGTAWVDLGEGAFQPRGDDGAVVYAGGNVGIGTFASPPTYRLEVQLGPNTAEKERVRFGNAVCSNGVDGGYQAYAYFYHKDRDASNANYALRLGRLGNVHLNASTGQELSFRQNDKICLSIAQTTGHVIVGDSEDDLPGAAENDFLQVKGNACKTEGGETWHSLSDARLKEDIRDLEAGLQQLLRVRPVRFRDNGKAGTTAGHEGVGIIGQEIEQIFPEMVQRVPYHHADELDGDDLLVYNGSALTYVLVNAVKELANKVEKLEAALAEARKGQ